MHQLDEERIFHLARKQPDAASRNEYLDQICSGDQALRERVEALLQVHEKEQEFLKSGSPQLDETVDHKPILEGAGTTIGRYKLREVIGEGGMGTVFVAQQDRPIRRKVALKVIKPGMDSKAVIARFEAERQALALMDHPSIAKVLDAGTTDQGHPYFVMELIQGKPLTEYCDHKKLTIKARLELFTQICNAVQHAHQKGVIHRDIKPSNILVTEIDGKPVPKVIDFGVAKALGANLTDRTIYTSFQSLVGTPLYMSPEQTQLSGVDVDTSSDVYSLGILLYELLTGTTPLSPEELKQAAHDEVLRRIRETEPPRPSNRISSLGETSSQVSECRSVQPEQLGRSVRGDLDWIVMKALEKDRNRRYKTADAFAADIDRHLTNEPVEARPPSTAYRLSRFYRRNKALVGVIGAILFVTVAATVVTTASLLETDRKRIEAEQSNRQLHQLAGEMQDVLIEFALLQAVAGEAGKVEQTLAAYEERIDADGKKWLPTLRGVAYFHQGDNVNAIRELESVVDRTPDDVAATAMLSVAYVHEGEVERGLALARQLRDSSRPNEMGVIERLFYGYSLAYLDYRAGARILDDVLAEHPTWAMARVYRAGTHAHVSEQTDEVEDVANALEEFAIVRPFVENNTYALMVDLFIHKEAIEMYRRHGLSEDALVEAALPTARNLLRDHPDYQTGQLIAGQFYDLIDESELADEAWQNVLRLNSGWWESAVARYYATHSTEETLQRITETGSGNPAQDLAMGLVLANKPQSVDEAIRIFKSLSHDSTHGIHSATIPLLVGQRDSAEKQCARWLEQGDPNFLSNPRIEYGLELIAGRTDEKLSGNDLMLLSVYEYAQGVLAISDGNQDSAKHHLEECVKLGPILPLYYWAKAFLSHLDEDG